VIPSGPLVVEMVKIERRHLSWQRGGRLLFQLLGAVGEFERQLAIERTRASVEQRRSNGGNLGGRRKSYSKQKHQLGHRLRGEVMTVSKFAAALGLSKGSVHRLLLEPLKAGV